jgi:excisionase family DNA binding protein
MSTTKVLYRPEEVAEALSVSRAKVYELIGRGELASITTDRSRRIPAQDLRAFVERLRVGEGTSVEREPVAGQTNGA